MLKNYQRIAKELLKNCSGLFCNIQNLCDTKEKENSVNFVYLAGLIPLEFLIHQCQNTL